MSENEEWLIIQLQLPADEARALLMTLKEKAGFKTEVDVEGAGTLHREQDDARVWYTPPI